MPALSDPTNGQIQTRQARVSDLARDITAMLDVSEWNSATPISRGTIQAKPTLLRRAGALLAELVPVQAERLVGERGAEPLVVATSLATGLPFAIVEQQETVVGELHPGEQLLVVTDGLGPVRPTAVLWDHLVKNYPVIGVVALATNPDRPEWLSVLNLQPVDVANQESNEEVQK